MIRVSNKWCAPLKMDLGSPIGEVRLPKTLPVELEIDFNDLKLSKRAEAMVRKGTLVIEDLDLPVEEVEPEAKADEGDAAPAQGAEPELASAAPAEEAAQPAAEPTGAQPKGAVKKKDG